MAEWADGARDLKKSQPLDFERPLPTAECHTVLLRWILAFPPATHASAESAEKWRLDAPVILGGAKDHLATLDRLKMILRSAQDDSLVRAISNDDFVFARAL